MQDAASSDVRLAALAVAFLLAGCSSNSGGRPYAGDVVDERDSPTVHFGVLRGFLQAPRNGTHVLAAHEEARAFPECEAPTSGCLDFPLPVEINGDSTRWVDAGYLHLSIKWNDPDNNTLNVTFLDPEGASLEPVHRFTFKHNWNGTASASERWDGPLVTAAGNYTVHIVVKDAVNATIVAHGYVLPVDELVWGPDARDHYARNATS